MHVTECSILGTQQVVALARAFKNLKTTVPFVHHMLSLIKTPFGVRL